MVEITPLDIQNQQFKVRFRGFDIREVDQFLDVLARALDEWISENRRLRETIGTLETRVAELEEAQRNPERREAEGLEVARNALLQEARKAAKEILEGARKEMASLRGEVERLEHRKKALNDYFEYFLEFNEKILHSWRNSLKEVGEGEQP